MELVAGALMIVVPETTQGWLKGALAAFVGGITMGVTAIQDNPLQIFEPNGFKKAAVSTVVGGLGALLLYLKNPPAQLTEEQLLEKLAARRAADALPPKK